MSNTIRRTFSWSVLFLVLPAAAEAQQPLPIEVYQDFRNSKPLLPEFRLYGPDHDAVSTFEPAGLRIKLPKTRGANQPISVRAKFVITGDFEITGAYELLAADFPTDGYGAGVSLNLGTTEDWKTFLKVARLMRPNTGSVHMAEYWTKGNNDWKGPQVPTEVRSGQLRLVREGARARCQISEGPGKEFKTIFEKADFSTDDIQHMVFQVTDGNKPGYEVDARLVDLRVRHGRSNAKAEVPVPGRNVVPQAEQPADTSLWLVISFALCSAMTLIVLGAFVVFLLVRRRREVDASSPPVEIVAFNCESCGKNLKTKAVSAGKSLKCPKCGTTVVVPTPI